MDKFDKERVKSPPSWQWHPADNPNVSTIFVAEAMSNPDATHAELLEVLDSFEEKKKTGFFSLDNHQEFKVRPRFTAAMRVTLRRVYVVAGVVTKDVAMGYHENRENNTLRLEFFDKENWQE